MRKFWRSNSRQKTRELELGFIEDRNSALIMISHLRENIQDYCLDCLIRNSYETRRLIGELAKRLKEYQSYFVFETKSNPNYEQLKYLLEGITNVIAREIKRRKKYSGNR